jgi:ATP-dependent Clp protease ATP-binding subunit ClpB
MDLANLKEDRNEMLNGSQRKMLSIIQAIKRKLKTLNSSVVRTEGWQSSYGKIKKSVDILNKESKKQAEGTSLIKEEVTREDIAEVVAKWTGIMKNAAGRTKKNCCIWKKNYRRVVGQEEGIEAVSDAVRRSRAGLQDMRKPVGTFLFLGTTGVGKNNWQKH